MVRTGPRTGEIDKTGTKDSEKSHAKATRKKDRKENRAQDGNEESCAGLNGRRGNPSMNILIAAIGRAKRGPEQELFQAYAARHAWRIDLKEIEIRKEQAVDVRRAMEGEALLAAVPDGARIVALDERGIPETSAQFAARLGAWRDDGIRTIAFLIGGADGLDGKVREAAHAVLCFGAMTWPHMLARVMLAEQLYRAHSILSGHPYHRE